MTFPPLHLVPAWRVPDDHVVMIREADGTVHRVARCPSDLTALYGAALPALMAGKYLRVGNTTHYSITAAAERGML